MYRLVVVAALSVAAGCGPPDGGSGLRAGLVIRDVSIVDVENGQVVMDQTVVIEGNRIVSVLSGGARGTAPSGARVRVVEGGGRYLIPGLWDMHTHTLNRWSWGSLLNVANGVTGIRDPGTYVPLEQVARLRADVASGRVVGPRLATSGPIIDGVPPVHREYLALRTASEMRDAVDSLRELGADFIKVYSRLSREAFDAAVEATQRHGVPLSGHVPLWMTVREASEAGMRSIEHAYRHRTACATAELAILRMLRDQLAAEAAEEWPRYVALEDSTWRLGVSTFSPEKCRELGETFARNGTWFVPTLVEMRSRFRPEIILGTSLDTLFSDPNLRYFPPAAVARWRDNIARDRGYQWGRSDWGGMSSDELAAEREREISNRFRMVAEVHGGGAGILAGTDASLTFPLVLIGFSLHEELQLLVAAGLSTVEALRAATLYPARFLNATDSLGTITPGKIADLVLLDGNPLEDIGNTSRIRGVVLNGRYLDRIALDGLLSDAESAAKK